MNARTNQLRGGQPKSIRVTDATDAELWRLAQAHQLLLEAGWYQHSDGDWYDHPEAGDDDC